ncbi:MAG: ABC transporter ATP-binding protein [Ectobacillus sp.]
MNSNQAAITVNRVVKQFEKKEVVSDISFTVRKNQIYGLVGPSGSGKTTLIKMIAGISEATKGEVTVLNTRMPNLEGMKRIGYMAQADALYGELSAYENMDFMATMYGLKQARKKQRIQDMLALVNLTEHQSKPVHQFSGGMKKRLSLAIALLHEPDVLILDEPTVGIDPILRKSIWKEFHNLRDNGTTILITTHIMDEAELCEQLCLLRDGRLLAVGTPAALKEQTGTGRLEDVFLMKGAAEQ